MKMATIQFVFSGKIAEYFGSRYYITDHDCKIILENIKDYDPKKIMVVFSDHTLRFKVNTRVKITGEIEMHRINSENYVKFVGKEVVAID